MPKSPRDDKSVDERADPARHGRDADRESTGSFADVASGISAVMPRRVRRNWLGRSVSRINWRMLLGLLIFAAVLMEFGQRIYRAIEHDLSTAAISGRASISKLAANALSQEFQRLIDVSRSLASRVHFGELVKQGRWDEAAQIMSNVPREFAAVEQVLIVDPQGTLRAAQPIRSELVGNSIADAPWYQAVKSGNRRFLSDVQVDRVGGRADFFVAAPVLDGDGKVHAILALRIAADRLEALFDTLRFERNGSIHVVDPRGVVAYDSAHTLRSGHINMSDDPIVKRVLAGDAGVDVGTEQIGGENRYVTAFAPTSFGWGVIAQWPHTAVFAARDNELRRVVVATTLLIVTTIAVVALTIQLAVQRKQGEVDRRVNLLLEQRVKRRTEQLEHMNRELESFSYSVSHDLRAPLRAIDGFSQLLLAEGGAQLSPDAQRYADNIHRNVARMGQLIDEMLELARLGRAALSYETVDTDNLVREVLSELLPQGSATQVELRDLPRVRADVRMLRQVWRNLLDNAIKYSSRTDVPRVEITANHDGNETVFCIADNGAGFDMQYYDRLFNPFSRLHAPGDYAGTGVGLAIVRRIVERHGGRVWAHSVLTQGTQMYFSLPGARSRFN